MRQVNAVTDALLHMLTARVRSAPTLAGKLSKKKQSELQARIARLQAQARAKDGDCSPSSWLRLDLEADDTEDDGVDSDDEPWGVDEPDDPNHGRGPSPPPPPPPPPPPSHAVAV